jgi:hypothetical protein
MATRAPTAPGRRCRRGGGETKRRSLERRHPARARDEAEGGAAERREVRATGRDGESASATDGRECAARLERRERMRMSEAARRARERLNLPIASAARDFTGIVPVYSRGTEAMRTRAELRTENGSGFG